MRTMFSMNTKTMGGIMTGSVTRIIVWMLEAPETRAASSSVTSMFRNAGVSSMTWLEMALPMRWAKMMPGTEYMLKGASSMKDRLVRSELRKPM